VFTHEAVFLSSWGNTLRVLGFMRHGPSVERPDSGEETPRFQLIGSFDCDVQPTDATRQFNERLTTTYGNTYTVTFTGTVSLRRGDRTVIDGALCVIDQIFNWGGHTEALCGSTEPEQPGW
jgi:hypothetical protein